MCLWCVVESTLYICVLLLIILWYKCRMWSRPLIYYNYCTLFSCKHTHALNVIEIGLKIKTLRR